MSPLARLLHETTHSRGGIWKTCAALLLLGLASAWAADALIGSASRRPPPVHDSEQSPFAPETAPPPLPPEQLLELADTSDPAPDLWFWIGQGYFARGDYAAAADAFARANEEEPSNKRKYFLLESLARGRLTDRMDELARDPGFLPLMRGGYLVREGFRRRDFPMVLRNFWIAEYTARSPVALFTGAFTALIWGAVFLHLLPAGRVRPLLPLVAPAFFLGWASTWCALLTRLWIETGTPLGEGSDFLGTLAYHLIMAGLNEEAWKLLWFAPLLLWLLRRGDDLDTLLLGAFVGLGFATRENLTYFQYMFAGAGGVSRFATATFLHCLLTGVCALALSRVVRQPARWAQDSLLVFCAAVGLHGVYNALLSAPIPGFGDMSYFAGTALAFAAHLYFRELNARLSPGRRVISVTALFFWGYCMLFNLELILAATFWGLRDGITLVGGTALSALIFVFVFLHHIQEPIGD